MKRFKGTVKNNVVLLENGQHLPDGTQVEIRVPKKLSEERRRQAFERIRRNPITRYIRIDEVLDL